jgi:hypothetical protein
VAYPPPLLATAAGEAAPPVLVGVLPPPLLLLRWRVVWLPGLVKELGEPGTEVVLLLGSSSTKPTLLLLLCLWCVNIASAVCAWEDAAAQPGAATTAIPPRAAEEACSLPKHVLLYHGQLMLQPSHASFASGTNSNTGLQAAIHWQ